MVNAHCADALVCISNCDKITPGMLMAAMRLNIPTIFVSGGPMEAGKIVGTMDRDGKPTIRKLDLIDSMIASSDSKVSDEELLKIDRFVRGNTVDRFGPVRVVKHEPDTGLVLEVAFEGLQRSTRHKSGLAMRFPRISRLRWDKPPREADKLETLELMLEAIERGRTPASPPIPAKV